MTRIMKYLNNVFLIVGIIFFFHGEIYGEKAVIEPPENATAIENKAVTWTCKYSGSDLTQCILEKMLPNGNFSPVFKLKSGCIAYYPRINFTFSCNSTVFKITKGYVPRSDHLSTWRCRFVTNSLPVQNLFSESSKLIVQVPIHNVTMTVPNGNLIYVIENKRSTFICNTSEGYPEAKISWFINSKTPYNTTDEKEVTKDSSQLSDQNKYPFSVESKLQLYPSKNYNGTRIYCKASNVGNKVPVTSGRKPLLYVQYPPTSPHFYIDSLHVPVENVSVILNNTISVFCESNSDPKSKYAWTLPNRTDIQTNVLTFGNVQKEDDGKYCCMAENWIKTPDGNITKRTNESYIQLSVLFPPENPSLYYHEANGVMNIKSLPLKVVKGDSIKISCNSTGNPQPHSQWDGHGNDNEIKYTSIEKNRTILCKATNQMNDTLGNVTHGTSETNLTIHVMYPPTEPTLLFSTDTIPEMRVSKPLRIIENSTFTLRCLGHSDPYPSYHWTNQSVVNNSLIINNTQRHQSRHFTCNVKNVMNRTFGRQEQGTNSTSISVDVLYPPDIPALYYYSKDHYLQQINDFRLAVVRGDTFHLFCNSTGNPRTISWWSGHQPRNDTLLLKSLKDNVTSTCYSENILNATGKASTKGSSDVVLAINVMFQPSIVITFSNTSASGLNAINNTSIKENSNFNLTCTADSNPVSSYYWLRPESNSRESGQHLRVYNISRKKKGPYICFAYNTMNRSFGEKEDSKSNQSLYFNIVYKTTIKSFATTDHQYHRNMTINVTDSVNLLCNVESNPKSNILISFNGEILNDTTGSDRLFFQLSEANCSNAGIYVCSGANEYNYGSNATREFTVYVKCQPQPSTDMGLVQNISAALHRSKTLRFRVLPYLDSGVTTFNWFKQDTPVDNYIEHSGRIHVWSSSIESNLTINSVSESDFGEYRIEYNNSVGFNSFTFYLQGEKALVTSSTDIETSKYVGVVAACVSGVVIIIVVIAGSIYLYKKRHKTEPGTSTYQNVPFGSNGRQRKESTQSLDINETRFEALQEVDDVPKETNESAVYTNSLDIIEKIERVEVSELLSYVLGKSEDSFAADFKKLPSDLQKPCIIARKPGNLPLNRYNGIYPYDHSRVQLHGRPDFFINANYIDGYKRSKQYIASLGPTEKTTNRFTTFWQMVWHEKSDIIVMLTNLKEPSGMKCQQYWPEKGGNIWYEDVCVSLQRAEFFAEYNIRTFTISKNEERRLLTHLHYTAWPDKKVPEDATSLLEFRQRLRATPTSAKGPIVIHCSAGIGRTGTLIALDRLIEEGQCEGYINVFECVKKMRAQRVKMVQTQEQYIYIYKALINALTFDCEAIPIESFQEYVDTTNNNVYSRQFQQLKQVVETGRKDDLETYTLNEKQTDKNRHGADIPCGRFTVMLYLSREDEGLGYINAVYVNSFKKKDYFIVAQSPLPNTVSDFICMIYQEDCSCIVTMDDLKQHGMAVGQYLPEDKQTLSFGHFTVSCSRLETKHHYTAKKMKIRFNGKFASGEKVAYHFQYSKWMAMDETPVNAKEFVEFVNDVDEYASQLGEERSHVLVHCLKSNERSGLFCAVAILMEKMKLERQVSVLNTLTHLRTRRLSAITSMEQLKFCYQAVSAYIKLNKQ